jgi:hypothetical protein
MDAAPLSTVSKHRGDDEQAIMVPYVAASMGAVEMSIIQAEDNGDGGQHDQSSTKHNVQRRFKMSSNVQACKIIRLRHDMRKPPI